VVGRKHVGKTTLVVQLAAELTRRGHRVMTLKHGSHTFNLDPAATDTYRHYHEGGAERVAMASPDKFALVQRWSEELGPEEIAARYLAEAHLVLCEGFKSSAIPKLEIHRREVGDGPLWTPEIAQSASWRALLGDAPVGAFTGRQFDLAATDWLAEVSTWVEQEIMT
jgi:molybdopterin-guanine dinucleotide biosynthesis protein MobB